MTTSFGCRAGKVTVRVTELAEPIAKSHLEKSFDQRQAATKAILEADARA